MAAEINGSARSYLYVPADRPDRLNGALGRAADALILDLEDSVAPDAKPAARATLGAWLAEVGPAPCKLWVRINSVVPELDIAVAVTPAVSGVVVPKAGSDVLAEVDGLLTAREQELGLRYGAVRVLALIETAAGLLSAYDIARAPRVHYLGLGEADLAAELRLHPTHDRAELTSLRLQLVVASAAAGIRRPVAPTSTDFRDLESWRRSTESLLRLGFGGRTAVHPAQIPIINEVFTPSAEELEQARRLIAAYDAAQRKGVGVLTDDDGRVVDVAVVRSAWEILSRAGTT